MAALVDTDDFPNEIRVLLYVKHPNPGSYESYGGWRLDLLIEQPKGSVEKKFLLCSLCNGMLRDARLYQRHRIQELRCSVCIPPGVNNQIAQINRELINQRQVYCPLNIKGCDWANELSELLHHLEECELFPVTCPLGCRDERGEVSRVERRGVETHRTCCPMRTVKCDYCSRKVKACKMNQHLELCEEFPIFCPNGCKDAVGLKRKDESIHLIQHCLLQQIACPYSQYGCEAKAQRRRMTQHEKKDMDLHLRLTMGNMQSKLTKLEEENTHLKAQVSTLVPRGCLEWEVDRVRSKYSSENKTYSDEFYVGLYTFQAYIDWSSKKNYAGLFLCIMRSEHDDTLRWPLRYKYSIVLINQFNTESNFEKNGEITKENLDKFPECFQKPITEYNDAFGHDELIPFNTLFLERYSQDDAIELNISVEQIFDS